MNQQHWSLGRKCCVALGCLAVSFPVTLVAQDCPPNLSCTVTRECSLPEDTRDCHIKLPLGTEIDDPACESAKAAHNAAYQANKAACEAEKSAEKLSCERTKQQERSACIAANTPAKVPEANTKCSETVPSCDVNTPCVLQEDKRSCEHDVSGVPGGPVVDPVCAATKDAQNQLYRAAKASCEAQNSAKKAECERMKATARLTCADAKSQAKAPETTAQCSPGRSCDATRTCPLQEDTRDCRITIGLLSWNDPACEAVKSAQNASYRAVKAACDAQTSSDKADCERTKEQERSACEAKKAKK